MYLYHIESTLAAPSPASTMQWGSKTQLSVRMEDALGWQE